MSKNPYEILQVSPRAEPEVIEAAYRRLARKYHPDVDPNPEATYRMQQINWAYETLRDPIRRARHDREVQKHRHSRSTATRSDYREPRPRPSYDQQPKSSGVPKASQKRAGESATSTALQPRTLISVFIASLLLGVYYGLALLFIVIYTSIISIVLLTCPHYLVHILS